MRLRLEPGQTEEENYLLAPEFLGILKDSSVFSLVAGILDGSIGQQELHWLYPSIANELPEPLLSEWFSNGWDHAFWVHTAPRLAAEDIEDADGSARKRVLESYFSGSTLGNRKELRHSAEGISLGSNRAQQSEASGAATFSTQLMKLAQRRTRRRFRRVCVELASLSAILELATERIRRNRLARSEVPQSTIRLLRSYGCWLEVGLAVFDVEGVEAGLYRYDIGGLSIQPIRSGDFRHSIYELLWKQSAPLTGAYTIVLFVDFEQARWRYRHQRGLRNIFIDIGRIGQDFILAGIDRSLGSFVTPALKETELAHLFGTEPFDLFPTYTITQGP